MVEDLEFNENDINQGNIIYINNGNKKGNDVKGNEQNDSVNDNVSDEDFNISEDNIEMENIDVGESFKEITNLMEDCSLEVNGNKRTDKDKIKFDEAIVKKYLKMELLKKINFQMINMMKCQMKII